MLFVYKPRMLRGFFLVGIINEVDMQKILVETDVKKIPGDVHTPVSIYLRLRDRFRDTVLLESADSHTSANSFSYICINAIAGIELQSDGLLEVKFPGKKPERKIAHADIPVLTAEYLSYYETVPPARIEGKAAQSLYGYTSYDMVPLLQNITFKKRTLSETSIPGFRYRLFQYVIVMNHFKDEMFICENKIAGIDSQADWLETLIRSRDLPLFPFSITGDEISNMTDEEYKRCVEKGIAHCHRGDVFQIVLSRRFSQSFMGDEFNVYRALRSVNPSPYLFYFDYGDYRLFGSSPESQLIVRDRLATLHPIAGTFKRTGNDLQDRLAAEALQQDTKERAEHIMLVDLARNDLSRLCSDVYVDKFQVVQFYSHVIHLVSEVKGYLPDQQSSLALLKHTFPAGTLTGAPKHRAMRLIDDIEPTARSYYGGCVGAIGLDGSFNQAIMIRTFLSQNNTLFYQAGAGVVAASLPDNELQEVNNKLGALKKAIIEAQTSC
jgi:anthranilate synthase component 1